MDDAVSERKVIVHTPRIIQLGVKAEPTGMQPYKRLARTHGLVPESSLLAIPLFRC